MHGLSNVLPNVSVHIGPNVTSYKSGTWWLITKSKLDTQTQSRIKTEETEEEEEYENSNDACISHRVLKLRYSQHVYYMQRRDCLSQRIKKKTWWYVPCSMSVKKYSHNVKLVGSVSEKWPHCVPRVEKKKNILNDSVVLRKISNTCRLHRKTHNNKT